MGFSHRSFIAGVTAIAISTSTIVANPESSIRSGDSGDLFYHGNWEAPFQVVGSYLPVVTHGEYQGKPLQWVAKWYPNKSDEPGSAHTDGEESAWCLINNHNFQQIPNGNPLTTTENDIWIGWNSNAVKVAQKLPTIENDYDTLGDWGVQLNQLEIEKPVKTTWKNGAEGAYLMVHEGLGELPYDEYFAPIQEQLRDHPSIKSSFAVSVPDMDSDEWRSAIDLVAAGHELVVGNSRFSQMNDVVEVFYAGDTILSTVDRYIPEQFHGAIVTADKMLYPEKEFQIPAIHYPNGFDAMPETLWTTTTLAVSPGYGEGNDSIVVNGKKIPCPGYISATSLTWSDEQVSTVPSAIIKTVPALPEELFLNFLDECRKEINSQTYNQIVTIMNEEDRQCNVYYSSRNILSLTQRNSLDTMGFLAAIGGNFSHRQISQSEFIHPSYINIDFYEGVATGETPVPSHLFSQGYSLEYLPTLIADLKGVMIRGLSGVNASPWTNSDFLESELQSVRIIEANVLKDHYHLLDSLVANHRIAVYTPSELIKSKLSSYHINPLEHMSGNAKNEETIFANTLKDLDEKFWGGVPHIIEPQWKTGNITSGQYPNAAMIEPSVRQLTTNNGDARVAFQYNPTHDTLVLLHQPVAISDQKGKNVAALSVVQNGSALSLTLPAGEQKLVIYSLAGRALFQKDLVSEQSKTHTLSLSQFAKGLFILEITEGDQLLLKQKISKQ